MGIFCRSLLVAGALTLGLAGPAVGADFRFPPEPVVPVPAPIPIPEYEAWYLRGDVAYGFFEDPDVSQGTTSFRGEDVDETWGFGIGFGRNFGENFRADLTLDYRLGTDVQSTAPGSGNRHTAELTSTVALLNVYYDIHSRESFSPYVGAGIGFSYNELDEHVIRLNGAQVGTTGGDDNTDLAAALMAGLAFRRNDDWVFDLGYRYLYLGDAKTDAVTTTGIETNDIHSHELRFGVRFEFR